MERLYGFRVFVLVTSFPQMAGPSRSRSVQTRNLLLFKTVIAGDSWGLIAVPVIQVSETRPSSEAPGWRAEGWAVGLDGMAHSRLFFGGTIRRNSEK